MINTTFGGSGVKVPVTIFNDPVELGTSLAHEILEKANIANNMRRPYLLGCPSGRSLQSTYTAIGELARARSFGLSNLVIVMMDEYVVKKDESFVNCPENAHYSCHRFAREKILDVISENLPKHMQALAKNVWFPDPADPSAYDVRIERAGGINMSLIASGASEGHVASNPPGSNTNTMTRIISLTEIIRKDSMETFPGFKSLGEVPLYGLSIGLKTIVQFSQEVVLVIHGQYKQDAVKRLSECSDFTPDWPASIIFKCNRARIVLDKAAAMKLT